ncbi:uncharacterized protein LOC135385169 isoform X1 [Ornithodoros turicata]|uniref:uncharacterized protein LOC135385169 isoform X1 n=1 Tax=Ornithodoros turicata TaxID=34597 RepID=UPI003138B59C
MIEFIIPFIVTAVLALTGPPLRLIRVITDNLRQVSHDTSTSNLVRFRSASTETLCTYILSCFISEHGEIVFTLRRTTHPDEYRAKTEAQRITRKGQPSWSEFRSASEALVEAMPDIFRPAAAFPAQHDAATNLRRRCARVLSWIIFVHVAMWCCRLLDLSSTTPLERRTFSTEKRVLV